jgi:hypothetical protein
MNKLASNCNNMFFATIALIFLSLFSINALAAPAPPVPPKAGGSGVVYYVSSLNGNDSNLGTSTAAAFKTIGKAAWIVNPGDTVYVMNGTYAEQVYINRSGSASLGYITYQAYPGQKPVLANYNAYAAFNFASGISYVIVDGFTVTGNAQSLTASQAQSMISNTSSAVNNGDCIAAKGNHIVIRNNTLAYCPGEGLAVTGDYLYIYNNIVHDNAYWSPLAKSGISVQGQSSDTSAATKIWIYNNIVYNNQNFICNKPQTNPCVITDGEGIISDSNKVNDYDGRTLIFNNVIYNNGGPAVAVFDSQHVDVVNNTTYMNNVSATEPAPYNAHAEDSEIPVGNSSDVRVLNNIMYSRTGAPILYIFGTDLDEVDWDYNIDYNSVGTLTGVGSHNLVVNPLCVNAGAHNFNLKAGSPAIDAGTNIVDITTDFASVARTGGIDIGAFQNQ